MTFWQMLDSKNLFVSKKRIIRKNWQRMVFDTKIESKYHFDIFRLAKTFGSEIRFFRKDRAFRVEN